jgi:isopenicillin N synthase-like dioxygenase
VDSFASALGFPEGYFHEPMNIYKEDSLSRVRLLHYPASETASSGLWRAGSHTDVGCLTLLFQQDGGDGLEICPGRESSTSNAIGDKFYALPAKTGPIVVNIGDMLSKCHLLTSRGKTKNPNRSL